MPDHFLLSYVGPDNTYIQETPYMISWFDFNMHMPPQSEREYKEIQQAIQQQLELGVLIQNKDFSIRKLL